MKNAHSILSSITNQPQFGSLVQHTCYQKFMALLPPRFQKAIAFVYIKNETLFIALSHPGFKMELNYNKDLMKSLLKTVQINVPQCSQYKADKVILFNSKFHTPASNETPQSVPHYSELAEGNFSLESLDCALQEKFEQSKALIAKNRHAH